MIYGKGAVLNLYQIMMDEQLPFDYRVVWKDEYKTFGGVASMTEYHERRKMEVVFNIDKFKPYSYPQI